MNNYTYIANANNDTFNIEIPAFDTGTAIPSPTFASKEKPTEMEQFTSKSITSFGTMAICIVIFLVIAFIVKNFKKDNVEYNTSEIIGSNKKEITKAEEYIVEKEPEPIIKQRKKGTLNTPSSIHKCILSFLENTKEN